MELEEAIAHLDDILSSKDWECDECKTEHIQLREYLAELQEYRKAILNNTLIKLPCKVGDTVYMIIKGVVKKYWIVDFQICLKSIYASLRSDLGNEYRSVNIKYFGESVFFTREEAEKALKEREK